jgi:hypothetical protein
VLESVRGGFPLRRTYPQSRAGARARLAPEMVNMRGGERIANKL